MRAFARLVAALALVILAAGVRAETVTVGAVRDNTLYQTVDGSLSNGAGGHFFTGVAGGNLRRRGLVAFDIAGAVPASSVINSVTLTLDMSQTSSGAHPVSLHRALADWGEGTSVAPGNGGAGAPSTPDDATWIHTFFDTELWAAPGGDFVASASATQTVDGLGVYSWSSAGMVTDVQAWLDDPSANFGWIVVGNEATSPSTKRFGGKDNADPAVHPVLQIEYEPVAPEPMPAVGEIGALVLAAALAGLAARELARRARQR
jgi:hypothetical protein